MKHPFLAICVCVVMVTTALVIPLGALSFDHAWWPFVASQALLVSVIILTTIWWRAGLVLAALYAITLSLGCASSSPAPAVTSDPIRQQYEELMRTIRVSETAMRAELASLRLATAKKDQDLQEARRHLEELRQARSTQQQTLEGKQVEVSKLRSERDQLAQSRQEIQIQLAELPQLRQTAADARMTNQELQVKLHTLETAFSSVTTDLALMKVELAERKVSRRSNGSPKKSVASPRADSSVPLGVLTTEAATTLTVPPRRP